MLPHSVAGFICFRLDAFWLLRTLSSYLLQWVMQGDFLVHFMDTAKEELMKKPDEISVEKLQVFYIVVSLVFCYL